MTSIARPLRTLRWAGQLSLLLLLVAFLMSHASAHSLRDDEAWLAWAIYYDPTQVTGQRWQIYAPMDALRFVRDDVVQAWERLRAAPLPTQAVGMLLNGWALLAGDSEIALRLPLVWGSLLLLALALRLFSRHGWRQRWSALVPLGLLALIVWRLTQPAPDWRGFIAGIAEQRASDQAAFVAWEPHSPIAYYDRRTPLRVGVSVDVGWRAFSADEFADLVARFDTYTDLWLLIDGREALVQVLQGLLNADRSLSQVHAGRMASLTVYRYQR